MAGLAALRTFKWHSAPAQLAIALGYILAAHQGFRVATVHPVVASVWPASGLALAALLLFGLRLWPGIFAGALAANAMKGVSIPASALIALGNTAAAISATLILRRVNFSSHIQRVRDAIALVGLGALLAPVLAATNGTLILHFLTGVPDLGLPGIWFTWWSGDAIGVMLLTPFLLAWINGQKLKLTRGQAVESVVLGVGLVVISLLLVRVLKGYEYAILPLVGWASHRGGIRGASTATLVVAAIAVWQTNSGVGPFIGTGHEGLWRLQLFLTLLVTGSLMIGVMATAHQRVTDALRASELRFRRVFECAGVGIAIVQPDGRIVDANPALHAMLGFSGAQLTGRTIADITHPEDWAVEKAEIERVMAGEHAPYRMAKRYLRRDGSVFWGKLTATHIPDGANGPGAAVKLVEDVSEQRAAQDALSRDQDQLQRTTQLLQTLVDAAPLAIVSVDPNGRVRNWNRAAEQLFGWREAEVIGQPVPFVPPESREEFRRTLRRVLDGEALAGHQVRRCPRDGIMLDLRMCAAPTRALDGSIDGVIAIVEDVTDRKRMGEQLRQAQKMEAIGQLTGGIAHDFNNLLTIIITNAALLGDKIDSDQAEMRVELSELQRSAFRGAELVRKLMTFSRKRDLELSAVNLGEVVSETDRALRRLLPKSVEILSQIDETGPLTIQGDVGAIEQIILNLATNARDAMPSGGTLRLAVYRAWLDKEHRRTHGWGIAGEYIVLAVSDTGSGMSPETRARVFEPFFTTKEPGKGTGLGMAMVYGLMKQHQGYIGLYSEAGRGTTFRLYFPAVRPCGEASEGRIEAAPPRGGTERIVVVDDEDGIRRSAARVLRRAGYTVDEAADGEGALALLSGGAHFNLVVSDLVMPRMGGAVLCERLRNQNNAVPVLLMSGYTTEDVKALKGAQPGLQFLHKPWTATDLLRRVRSMLDEAAKSA